MKQNHTHDNARSAGPQLVPVRFEFSHPTATTVSVAGTFNDWHPTTKPMHPSGKRSLAEGNGLAARHLRILFGGGRPLNTRSAGQGNRA